MTPAETCHLPALVVRLAAAAEKRKDDSIQRLVDRLTHISLINTISETVAHRKDEELHETI